MIIVPLIEGVEKKLLERHPDKRGFFEELIRVSDRFFQEGFGQLSHSFMYQGVLKAWHVHVTQVDWWYVASGTLHVALYDTRRNSCTYQILNEFRLGEKGEHIILKIPAGVAHGCKVLSHTSELFYVTSKTYNKKEEGRIDHNNTQIGYDWINIPIEKE